MHRTIEKKIFAGVAVALVLFLLLAGFSLWQVSTVSEARLLGTVALLGSVAYLMLLGATWLLLRRDLRNRDQTEQALREAEVLTSRLIESSTDCMALLDGEGRIETVNSAMWRWLEAAGVQPVEDLKWVETWAGEPHDAAKAAIAAAADGEVGRFQGLCHMRSGEGRWYDVTLTPLRPEEGKSARFLAVARDVTENHSADEKFRVLFEHSTNAHIIFDQDRILDCNHVAMEMIGCSTKLDVVGMAADDLSPECQPDGSPSCEKRLELWQLARDVGHFRYEWQARRRNGEDFSVEISLTPVSVNGREVLLAVWIDLTERRLAESALRESEHRFQAFMDHSPTLCFIKDDQGRMLFINEVMTKAFGVTTDEMIGKNDFDWLPLETARAVMEYDRRILQTNRAAQQIEVVTTGDGRTHEWLVVKFPILSSTGRKRATAGRAGAQAERGDFPRFVRRCAGRLP
jgi:PAS domain S-box-containing protein